MAAPALKTRPAGAKAAPCGYIFLMCAIPTATSFARCIAGDQAHGVIRFDGSRYQQHFQAKRNHSVAQKMRLDENKALAR
jgi:hypothetical protein